MEANCPYFHLTLVRHGETDSNKNDVIQGHLNTQLNATGQKQAELVAVRFQNECFTHVFSSDLDRAAKTADKIVEKNMFFKNSKVDRDSRLREQSYGCCEGRTNPEMRAMADELNIPVNHFIPEGGERPQDIRARVVDFFQALCKKLASERTAENSVPQGDPFANVLIASHGGTIKHFLYYFGKQLGCQYPVSYKKMIKRGVPNTGVSKFEMFLDLQSNLPKLIKCLVLNNDDHLGPHASHKKEGGEAGISCDDDDDDDGNDIVFSGDI